MEIKAKKEKKPMGKWTKRLLILAVSLWGVFIALMILVSMADEPAEDKAKVEQKAEAKKETKADDQYVRTKEGSIDWVATSMKNNGGTGVFMSNGLSKDWKEQHVELQLESEKDTQVRIEIYQLEKSDAPFKGGPKVLDKTIDLKAGKRTKVGLEELNKINTIYEGIAFVGEKEIRLGRIEIPNYKD